MSAVDDPLFVSFANFNPRKKQVKPSFLSDFATEGAKTGGWDVGDPELDKVFADLGFLLADMGCPEPWPSRADVADAFRSRSGPKKVKQFRGLLQQVRKTYWDHKLADPDKGMQPAFSLIEPRPSVGEVSVVMSLQRASLGVLRLRPELPSTLKMLKPGKLLSRVILPAAHWSLFQFSHRTVRSRKRDLDGRSCLSQVHFCALCAVVFVDGKNQRQRADPDNVFCSKKCNARNRPFRSPDLEAPPA